jgi:hypothetical protein
MNPASPPIEELLERYFTDMDLVLDLNDPGAIAEFIAPLVSGIDRVGPLPGHYRHP